MELDALQEEINGQLVQLEEGEESVGMVQAMEAASEQTRKNMMVMLIVLEAIQFLEDNESGTVFIPDALRQQFIKTLKV